jgi:hypothetical protein
LKKTVAGNDSVRVNQSLPWDVYIRGARNLRT